MLDVMVKVPEDHVAEFYSRHAEWLQSLTSANGAALPRREWTAEDGRHAKPVREGLPARPGAFLDLIVAEERLGEDEVMRQLGLSNPKQITGLHGWVGRVAARFGFKSPIKSEPTSQGGAVWSMDPEVAGLFKQ